MPVSCLRSSKSGQPDLNPMAEAEAEQRGPTWIYGCNDLLDLEFKTPPPGFQSTGFIKQDFPKICQLVGAVPHPAFRLDKPVVKPHSMQPTNSARRVSMGGPKRPSLMTTKDTQEAMLEAEKAAMNAALSNPALVVRSVLLDRASMQIFSFLMPSAKHLRSICFSDCRLDDEMMKLLRRGLEGACTVEHLQIEWNPFELPLPQLESLTDAEMDHGGCDVDDVGMITIRENVRYRRQCQRRLRAFGGWLVDLAGGGMEAVWQTLTGGGTSWDQPLTSSAFHDLFEDKLGAKGPEVAEIFDVLDGPDYAAGLGKTTLAKLRAALENLPEVPAAAEGNDPIGKTLSTFFGGESILESFSLRACAIGHLELLPMVEVLKMSPWQLRELNLWENRLDDRCAEMLAEALEIYRGLEFLGLARNRITDAGLAALCKAFQAANLDEAGKAAALARIAEQEGKPAGKAAAKAKAAAPRASVVTPVPGGRVTREPKNLVDELEERPPVVEGGEPSYMLRRPSELKILALSENPIRNVKTLETLQPLGPKGVDLYVKLTAAASALIAKRPELATKENKPFCPGGEGWVIRVA